MTLLERVARKCHRERRKDRMIKGKRSVNVTKRPSSARVLTQSVLHRLRRFYRSDAQRKVMFDPNALIELDENMTQALAKFTQKVLDQHNESGGEGCSLTDMTNGLIGKTAFVDVFAKANVVDNIIKGGSRWKSSQGLFRVTNDGSNERRYQAVNALNALGNRPNASTIVVSNWEEARVHLESVFVLAAEPESPKVVDDDAFVDKTMQDHKRRLRAEREQVLEEWSDLPSSMQYMQIAHSQLAPRSVYVPPAAPPVASIGPASALDDALRAELEAEYAARAARKMRLITELEREQEQKRRDEEAQQRAAALMRALSDEERALVHAAMYGAGDPDDVLVQVGADTVLRRSMQSLAPAEWLNDEIINFFTIVLAKRDEILCQENPGRLRSHFYKSFFVTKLLNDGSSKEGTYEYKNVKRWSKNVPGKDIFNLDKIVFPINEGRMHWVCVVAFMQERKICFYDSFGSLGTNYLEAIFQYIQEEHLAKKGAPLPDPDAWQLVPCPSDVPRQHNGYDCGVFTCMFADFVSKDCPLVFDQSHITKCRERIALSILKEQAIM